MTSKKQGLYEQVLDVIIHLAQALFGKAIQPEFVMSDYEIAILSAMSLKFPTARIRGCWFHYCQVN
jgi:hypothetical protein